MDHNEIINIYLTNVRIGINKLDQKTLDETSVTEVVFAEYHNMRLYFDLNIISKLSDDEIEEFFETLASKTNELIDSITSVRK